MTIMELIQKLSETGAKIGYDKTVFVESHFDGACYSLKIDEMHEKNMDVQCRISADF